MLTQFAARAFKGPRSFGISPQRWNCSPTTELIAGLQARASNCGLRNVGRVPANTESTPANPKRWLADHLRGDYQSRTAECLARFITLEQTKARNQSLQLFLMAVRQAAHSDHTP